MNEHKICFILCANNETLAEECLLYISQLTAPRDFEVETVVIRDAKSMTSGYNAAMLQSDAKYKVYLHQDVLLIYRDFIRDVVGLFVAHPEIGMLGVVGNTSLAADGCPWSDGMDRRIGEICADLISRRAYSVFGKAGKPCQPVIVLDGLLMATQYDLPWRENIFGGWDFYDCSQSVEFWKAGYQVVVPYMERPWCLHDNDILHLEHYEKWRRVFVREYGEFYRNWQAPGEGEKTADAMGKRAVYQRISRADCPAGFPYPPIYREANTDYICFTDRENLRSDFWEIWHVNELGDDEILPMLSAYEKCHELLPEEIQIGSLFPGGAQAYEPVMTVPSLHDIPEVPFDESRLIPTRDENGNYTFKKNPTYRKGKYHGRPYLLTIGILISNQIDTIERCLASLSELLEKLDAELLVVDTGSTDGTIEVCREYGARIVDFKWCDNMSAARNAGIYHAKGEWYLSIDDDEWFEDTKDILEFFRSGKYQKCQSATYIQRNYLYLGENVYKDNHTVRMARIAPELHFEGRIHDALVIPDNRVTCQLFSYVHHYGFMREDAKRLKEKYRRNVSGLLQDICEYPTDLRYNFQLSNELNNVGYYDTAAAYAVRGIAMEKELGNEYYGRTHAVNLCSILYNATDERLFPIVELIRDSYPYTLAEKAFLYYDLADLGLRLGHEPEEVLENYRRYEACRKEFEKNPNESLRETFVGLHVCTNRPFIVDSHVIAFSAYCEMGNTKEAMRELEQIEPEEIFDQRAAFLQHFLCAGDEVYEAALRKLPPVCAELWSQELLERFFLSLSESAVRSRQLSRLPSLLARISAAGVENFLQNGWRNANETIKAAVTEHALLSDADGLSLQELYFYSGILKEKIKQTGDERHMTFFLQYVWVTGNLAAAYYNTALLDDTQSCVIPADIRAAYHICMALKSDRISAGSIAHLRIALEKFPGFKTEIQTLLEQMEGTMR